MVRSLLAIIAFVALVSTSSVLTAARQKSDAPPPINISVAPQSERPHERYGDWTATDVGGGIYMATTANNVGSVFGTMCEKNTCFAFMNPSIGCNPSDQYPALINAPGGAFSVLVTCEKFGDLLIYDFDIGDQLSEAMAVGGVLGIAFPMASGEFKVARFSLTGAARATARIAQLAKGEVPASNSRTGSDENSL
jgi:hypothetical protein